MMYLGGKAKIAKHVADVICKHLRPGQMVWEPFCGGLNVTAELCRRGIDVIATDASVPLIALFEAVRAGWDPPSTLTREEYYAAKALPLSDPRHGFAQVCSWGGKPWGGYAKNSHGRDYTSEVRICLLRDAPLPALVKHVDFLAVEPGPLDAVIYCDPPYAGRTGYGAPFDHAAFVVRVQQWSRYCTVLVSEYEFPIGEIVFEITRRAELRGREKTHVERIYRVTP